MFKLFLTKVLLLGYAGASYIEENFIDITFSKRYLYTIGADFSVKKINVKNHEFKFQLWRISDNERFRNLRTIFYLGSHAVILCFDVTRPSTIDNLFLNWLPELERNLKNIKIPYILVGINTHKRSTTNPLHITKEQGSLYAKKISNIYSDGELPVYYFELSPQMQNSNLIFFTLARFILSLKNYGQVIFENDLMRFNYESPEGFIIEVNKSLSLVSNELDIIDKFSRLSYDKITINDLKEKIKVINKLDMELATLDYVIDEYKLQTGSHLQIDFRNSEINIRAINRLKSDILTRLYNSLSAKTFILEGNYVRAKIRNSMNELKLLMIQKRNVDTIQGYKKLKESFDKILSKTHEIKLIKKPMITEFDSKLTELHQASLFAINNFKKLVYDEYQKMHELEESLLPNNNNIEILTSFDQYKIICFTDRAEIDGKNILLAYHCPVCKIFLCSYCYNSLLEQDDEIILCPGTLISSEHVIELN